MFQQIFNLKSNHLFFAFISTLLFVSFGGNGFAQGAATNEVVIYQNPQ